MSRQSYRSSEATSATASPATPRAADIDSPESPELTSYMDHDEAGVFGAFGGNFNLNIDVEGPMEGVERTYTPIEEDHNGLLASPPTIAPGHSTRRTHPETPHVREVNMETNSSPQSHVAPQPEGHFSLSFDGILNDRKRLLNTPWTPYGGAARKKSSASTLTRPTSNPDAGPSAGSEAPVINYQNTYNTYNYYTDSSSQNRSRSPPLLTHDPSSRSTKAHAMAETVSSQEDLEVSLTPNTPPVQTRSVDSEAPSSIQGGDETGGHNKTSTNKAEAPNAITPPSASDTFPRTTPPNLSSPHPPHPIIATVDSPSSSSSSQVLPAPSQLSPASRHSPTPPTPTPPAPAHGTPPPNPSNMVGPLLSPWSQADNEKFKADINWLKSLDSNVQRVGDEGISELLDPPIVVGRDSGAAEPVVEAVAEEAVGPNDGSGGGPGRPPAPVSGLDLQVDARALNPTRTVSLSAQASAESAVTTSHSNPSPTDDSNPPTSLPAQLLTMRVLTLPASSNSTPLIDSGNDLRREPTLTETAVLTKKLTIEFLVTEKQRADLASKAKQANTSLFRALQQLDLRPEQYRYLKHSKTPASGFAKALGPKHPSCATFILSDLPLDHALMILNGWAPVLSFNPHADSRRAKVVVLIPREADREDDGNDVAEQIDKAVSELSRDVTTFIPGVSETHDGLEIAGEEDLFLRALTVATTILQSVYGHA